MTYIRMNTKQNMNPTYQGINENKIKCAIKDVVETLNSFKGYVIFLVFPKYLVPGIQ